MEPGNTEIRAKCFVAIPITTPRTLVDAYQGDEDHFGHVLEHLFVPAIELAGMRAISPLAQGASLVHAAIIDNIVRSDLVLCDMSGLNPNVFFEMGIRTAVNKSLCFVVDDLTEGQVPFDAGIVNYHVYSSQLTPWRLQTEIRMLAAHITATIEQSKGQNALWKYFGLRTQFAEAEAQRWPNTDDDRLGYLAMEVEAIRRRLDATAKPANVEREPLANRADSASIQELSAVLGLSVDLDRASIEDLKRLNEQLTARLARARTRVEETTLERFLAQVRQALSGRSP